MVLSAALIGMLLAQAASQAPAPAPPPPPPATALTRWPPATSYESSATFAFQSAPDGATFECRLDNSAFTSCASPWTYSNLTPGQHGFEVRVRVTAGPVATPASASWSVVSLPRPETSVRGLSGPFVLGSSARFDWTAQPDYHARFECSLDYAPFGDCQGTKVLAGVPPGSHVLQVRAVNDTGPDESPATYAWTSMVPLADLLTGYAIAGRTETERFPVGWAVSLDLAFADRWQVVSEASGDYLKPDSGPGDPVWRYSFLSGVRFVARSTHANVFGQALIGVGRTPEDIAAPDRFSYRPSWEPGVGVDFNVSQYVAIRFAGGRRYTHGANDSPWEWRFTNGVVWRFNRLE